MPSTSKTFIYKRARFESANKELTLQSLLERCYETDGCRTAQGRFLDIGGAIRCINYHGSAYNNSMQIGVMVRFEPGRHLPAIRRNDAADWLDMPLSPSEEETDFVQNVLYFGVSGNEIIILPSGSFNAAAFEEYLQWLLKFKSELLDADSYFSLTDYMPPDRQEKARYLEIVTQAYVEEMPGGANFIAGNATAILSSIFPSDAISLDKISNDSTITAKIRITMQKRPKTTDFDLLDDIADSFRQSEGIGYSFDTAEGMRISNVKEFRFSKSFIIPTDRNNMPRLESVWEAMHSWLDKISNLQTAVSV